MARTSNKDRDVNEMVMGTFRIKSGMWEDFKQLASQNNATATDLIISFIENCLQSQSIPQSVQDIDNSPQPNLDSIYKYIDNKLDNLDIQSRQNASVIPQPRLDAVYTYIDDKIDNLDNKSIQDIDDTVKKLIAESLEDGDIGDAIAKSYAAMMGQFNGLLEELQALQKQVQELQLNPPAAVRTVPSPQSPITNNQLPVTPEDVINFLAIEDILGGEEYWQEQLEIKGIDTKIKDNFEYFKSLGIEFKGVRDTAVSRFNCVLPWLGYKGTKQSTTIKQSNGLGVNKYIAVKVTKL